MIQAKLPKEHSTYQEENFEERCAFGKIVCFLISFPNNQQKKFPSVCICLSAILESCFLQKRGKLDFFSFPEGVCFAKISGHWMRTLMQSGNLLQQFHQNCSLRSLCNFFVKKVSFCEIPSVIIFRHFLKKNRSFGGIFLAFYYVFCTFGKIFFYVSRGISEENFPHAMSFYLL